MPRSDPSDGFAGGKVVKVDRLIWNIISDQQTALAALQAGEIDFVYGSPADFYSASNSDPNLALEVLDRGGDDMCLRVNHLQKPFDNVKARRCFTTRRLRKIGVNAELAPSDWGGIVKCRANKGPVEVVGGASSSRRMRITSSAVRSGRPP